MDARRRHRARRRLRLDPRHGRAARRPRSGRCFAASPSTSSAATCRSSTTAFASSKSGPHAHCFGVFPYATDMTIDAEDSLALQTDASGPPPPGARIAIVRFPHLSNATDFRLLTWADWIDLAARHAHYDFVILPGSKNTIGDLRGCAESDSPTGSSASTAAARPSSASAAAIRCSAASFAIPRRRSRRIRAREGSPCCRRTRSSLPKRRPGSGRRRRRGRDVRRHTRFTSA